MRTVHPCIIIGSYVWDQDHVPRDEFQARVADLNRVMDANGWKAVLVYGDAVEHSALAWFSAFTTRLRWGMALLPREGEPRLLISMSSRDVPAMKLMTWIADVHSGWNWESAFDPWLARFSGEAPIDFGTVGFDLMRPPLFASLQKSLNNRFRLHAADDAVAAVRTLRPRERSQIRAASRVVQVAASEFTESWRRFHAAAPAFAWDPRSSAHLRRRDPLSLPTESWRPGVDVEAAALEAERAARMMGAQDVRTLVSFDGGKTLAPYRGTFDQQSESLVGYIAVKHMGYWADTFVTAIRGPGLAAGTKKSLADDAHIAAKRLTLHDVNTRVHAALRIVLQFARAGEPAAELYEKACQALSPYPLHGVLSGSIGRRIGLSSNEGGEIRQDSRHELKAGEIYSLHVGTHDTHAGGAIASAMIEIKPNGYELLHLSPAADVR
jgi:Xaa-Pro aminopeptidase